MGRHGLSENLKLLLFLGAVGVLITYVGNDFLLKFETTSNSESVGTPQDGHLKNGKRLPSSGENFETYSRLGSLIGRTHVHADVRRAVVEAYEAIHVSHPDLRFVYGETGWPSGGEFAPHRTHQNGMSVDFMVPVRQSGESVPLPHSPLDKWGYDLEFNDAGRCDAYEIDFEAIGVHLLELDRTARKHGLKITRVIFEPELQKLLKKAESGKKALRKLPFSPKPAWIKHDEHYHVDFEPITKAPKATRPSP
jgi:penicillin-insensitive murein endopeptidase